MQGRDARARELRLYQALHTNSCGDALGNRWLPEIPEDHSTYPGEIPWADTYPVNELSELRFNTGTRILKKSIERLVLFRDSKAISEEETKEFFDSVADEVVIKPNTSKGTAVIYTDKSTEDALKIIEAALNERGLVARVCKVPEEREVQTYKTFKVLVPVRENTFSGEQRELNHTGTTPARQLTDQLKLCGRPQTFDLFEKDGKRASITLGFGEDVWRNRQDFIYLRQDLLERFLAETNTSLLWATWGERGFNPQDTHKFRDFADEHKPYVVFQDVRRYQHSNRPML